MVEADSPGIIHHVTSATRQGITHNDTESISGTPDSLARSIAARAISTGETTFVGISAQSLDDESKPDIRAILVFPLRTPAPLDDHPDDRQCVIERALGHVLGEHTAGVFVSTAQIGR